jgi:hypothetical protein
VRVAGLRTYFRVKKNDLGSLRSFLQLSLWYRLLESNRVLQILSVRVLLQGTKTVPEVIAYYQLSDKRGRPQRKRNRKRDSKHFLRRPRVRHWR